MAKKSDEIEERHKKNEEEFLNLMLGLGKNHDTNSADPEDSRKDTSERIAAGRETPAEPQEDTNNPAEAIERTAAETEKEVKDYSQVIDETASSEARQRAEKITQISKAEIRSKERAALNPSEIEKNSTAATEEKKSAASPEQTAKGEFDQTLAEVGREAAANLAQYYDNEATILRNFAKKLDLEKNYPPESQPRIKQIRSAIDTYLERIEEWKQQELSQLEEDLNAIKAKTNPSEQAAALEQLRSHDISLKTSGRFADFFLLINTKYESWQKELKAIEEQSSSNQEDGVFKKRLETAQMEALTNIQAVFDNQKQPILEFQKELSNMPAEIQARLGTLSIKVTNRIVEIDRAQNKILEKTKNYFASLATYTDTALRDSKLEEYSKQAEAFFHDNDEKSRRASEASVLGWRDTLHQLADQDNPKEGGENTEHDLDSSKTKLIETIDAVFVHQADPLLQFSDELEPKILPGTKTQERATQIGEEMNKLVIAINTERRAKILELETKFRDLKNESDKNKRDKGLKAIEEEIGIFHNARYQRNYNAMVARVDDWRAELAALEALATPDQKNEEFRMRLEAAKIESLPKITAYYGHRIEPYEAFALELNAENSPEKAAVVQQLKNDIGHRLQTTKEARNDALNQKEAEFNNLTAELDESRRDAQLQKIIDDIKTQYEANSDRDYERSKRVVEWMRNQLTAANTPGTPDTPNPDQETPPDSPEHATEEERILDDLARARNQYAATKEGIWQTNRTGENWKSLAAEAKIAKAVRMSQRVKKGFGRLDDGWLMLNADGTLPEPETRVKFRRRHYFFPFTARDDMWATTLTTKPDDETKGKFIANLIVGGIPHEIAQKVYDRERAKLKFEQAQREAFRRLRDDPEFQRKAEEHVKKYIEHNIGDGEMTPDAWKKWKEKNKRQYGDLFEGVFKTRIFKRIVGAQHYALLDHEEAKTGRSQQFFKKLREQAKARKGDIHNKARLDAVAALENKNYHDQFVGEYSRAIVNMNTETVAKAHEIFEKHHNAFRKKDRDEMKWRLLFDRLGLKKYRAPAIEDEEGE